MMRSIPNIKEVTPYTDHKELAQLDKKDAGKFQIWLMTDEHGARGHDYRAPMCAKGICLVIASAFPDRRSRVQGLLRVGRHKDKCVRVQVRAAPEIDAKKLGERKAKLY
jgi:hypothetical protein